MAALPRAALRLTRVTTLVTARLRGVDRGRQRGTNSCRYRCPSWQRSRLTLLDMATLRLTNAPSKHRCRCGGGTARPFRYRTFAIDYSGRPISRYSVVPRVAGYVTALHVTDNSHFRANELLVEIDPRDFEVAVKTAEANLQSAQAAKSNVQQQGQTCRRTSSSAEETRESVAVSSQPPTPAQGRRSRGRGCSLARPDDQARRGASTAEVTAASLSSRSSPPN